MIHLEIKNQYAKDDKYLAVVTGNGLWIRDKIETNTNYINAENEAFGGKNAAKPFSIDNKIFNNHA